MNGKKQNKKQDNTLFFVILQTKIFQAMKFTFSHTIHPILHITYPIPLLRLPLKNMGLRYKMFILLPAFCLLLSACNNNTFYHKTYTLPNETWNIDNTLVYEFEITDSLQFYNFFIDVRNTTEYTDQGLWLFFTTQFPDKTFFTDTLNCTISDAYGRWTGKGSGRIRDNRFVYKPKVRFPQTGTYIFSVQQAMRTNDLIGIADFGITLQYE